MDVKKIIMTLIEYRNQLFKALGSKIDKKELEEFFFWLIEYYSGFSRLKYILDQNHSVSNFQKLNLLMAIELLEKNMPIQYIVGESEFMNLKFYVNDKVLIPRPETEELVSWVLIDNPINKKILDIGTGSGCIAVSLAKFLKSPNVTAWDIDHDIIDLAKKNSSLNNVKILFEVQDINSINTNKKFDIIISNPPYICDSEKHNMKKNVLLFEPHKALFVYDKNPLFYYVKIIQFAKKSLKKNGLLFFEISERMKDDILKLLNKEGFHDIELKKDFRSKDRMVKVSF